MTLHDDAIVKTEEAEAISGMSRSWLEKARLSGNGPPFLRVGPKAVRYRVGDIRSWLASRRRSNTAQN